MNAMKICAMLMSSKEFRLRPAREKRKDGVRGFGPDHGGQLFARRTANAGDAAEGRQQRFATPRADAGHVVELGSQIAPRSRAPVKRDREAMRLVADALNQQ